MKNINVVDTKYTEWRMKRRSLWDNYNRVSSDDSKIIRSNLSIAENIFMGDIVSHKDDVLNKIHKNSLPAIYALYSPHQCAENWHWIINKGWAELGGIESTKDIVKQYIDRIISSHSEYREYGWTDNQRVELFDFLFGESYDPEYFEFNGEVQIHPLRPISIIRNLGLDICRLYTGRTTHKGMWLNRIDYCLQALESIDVDVFLPESVFKSREYSLLKATWAQVLMDESKLSEFYYQYRKENLQHSSCQNIDYGTYAATSEVTSVKIRIGELLNDGIFPPQIEYLISWCRAENANLEKLIESSLGIKSYESPWLEKPVQKKTKNNNEKTYPKSKSKKKFLLVPHEAEQYFLGEVNSLIDRALKGGMNDVESTFGGWEDIHQWNKKRNPRIAENGSKKTIIEYASLKREYKEVHLEAFLRLLYPKRVTEIDLDVFGEGGPEKITKIYRSAWSKILKLAYPETDQIKLKLKKEGESWDYEVTTKVAMNNQEQTYYYSVDSDWLDNTLFSDVVHFSEENKLKHRYHYIYNDTRVTVAYLPPSFSDLFEGILQ